MKNIFKILQYVFFLGFAFLMIAWSLKGVDIKYIVSIMLQAKVSIVLLTIIVVLLSHWVRALRWNLLINTLGYQPTTFNSFLSILIGYFANLFIPRLGEVLRCTRIAKYEKMPVDKIMGTVLLERIIDTVCLLFIALLVFLLQIDVISTFLQQHLVPKLKTINPLSYLLGSVVLILLFALLIFLSRKNKKIELLFVKIKTFLKGIFVGMKSVLKLQKKLLFLFYTILIWACYLTGFWVGFKALDATTLLGFVPALTCLVTGSIGMIATQGGIGAYPLLVGETLTRYGIETIYGVAMGWLNWCVQFLICVVAGSIAWVALPFHNRTKK